MLGKVLTGEALQSRGEMSIVTHCFYMSLLDMREMMVFRLEGSSVDDVFQQNAFKVRFMSNSRNPSSHQMY